ncbi:unnamed protein product [Caenorhabditis brenneri]
MQRNNLLDDSVIARSSSPTDARQNWNRMPQRRQEPSSSRSSTANHSRDNHSFSGNPRAIPEDRSRRTYPEKKKRPWRPQNHEDDYRYDGEATAAVRGVNSGHSSGPKFPRYNPPYTPTGSPAYSPTGSANSSPTWSPSRHNSSSPEGHDSDIEILSKTTNSIRTAPTLSTSRQQNVGFGGSGNQSGSGTTDTNGAAPTMPSQRQQFMGFGGSGNQPASGTTNTNGAAPRPNQDEGVEMNSSRLLTKSLRGMAIHPDAVEREEWRGYDNARIKKLKEESQKLWLLVNNHGYHHPEDLKTIQDCKDENLKLLKYSAILEQQLKDYTNTGKRSSETISRRFKEELTKARQAANEGITRNSSEPSEAEERTHGDTQPVNIPTDPKRFVPGEPHRKYEDEANFQFRDEKKMLRIRELEATNKRLNGYIAMMRHRGDTQKIFNIRAINTEIMRTNLYMERKIWNYELLNDRNPRINEARNEHNVRQGNPRLDAIRRSVIESGIESRRYRESTGRGDERNDGRQQEQYERDRGSGPRTSSDA